VRCYPPRVRKSPPSSAPPEICDLRGVPCPLNWARAKARLEGLRAGDRLLMITDAPGAERDVPPAVEAEGWAAVEVSRVGDEVRILIEL